MGFSPIRYSCVDVEFVLKDELHLAQWLERVARTENHFLGRLDYHFCSDEHLLEMNKQHLDGDYYTDVITFDESRPPLIIGAVFISIDRVKDNAEEFGGDFLLELYRVMVHGLLHLIGYGDKNEEEKQTMRDKESQALKMIH